MRNDINHIKYRPDIDGLRALSVIAVVIYHAFPNLLQGGFVGVDVFFVISGYLITSILFTNIESETFTFKSFYARRIKRIFPALIVVLIACYLFAWFALLSDEFKQLGWHISGSSLFISNLILLGEAGYFNNSSLSKPLLHLWSLGVEEQFYIFWPIILYITWTVCNKFKLDFENRWRIFFGLIFSISIISFYYNLKTVNIDANFAFFAPHTRFWEFLSGGLIAWIYVYKSSVGKSQKKITDVILNNHSNLRVFDRKKTFINTLSLLGLLILIFSFFTINDKTNFPGVWAVPPVIGAFLIIISGPEGYINRVLLSNKIFVWMGIISYPLYLWHWPLISFSAIVQSFSVSREIRISLIVASVLLALLTYLVVESPLRQSQYKFKTLVLTILLSSIGAVGWITYVNNGFGFRVSKYEDISSAAGEWEFPGSLEPFMFNGRNFYKKVSDSNYFTLIIGDSNAEQYYSRVDELINLKPSVSNSVIFATGGGCLPVPRSPYNLSHHHCAELMDSALILAQQDMRIINVVIIGCWNAYLSDGVALDGNLAYGGELYNSILNNLSLYIRELKLINKKVYLILSMPTGEQMDPKYMAQRSISNFPNLFRIRDGGVTRKFFDDKYGMIQNDLRNIALAAGATIINPFDYVCNSQFCPSVDIGGRPIYKDDGHFRPSYIRYNGSFIDETILNINNPG
jgi:peptidoglycan/LPS O-acetylase OafA/YrhL